MCCSIANANKSCRAIAVLAVAGFLTGAGMAAQAQELERPKPRQGYYFSAGAYGPVNANHNADQGWLGPWPGLTGSIRAGQALVDWLDLGIDIGAGGSFGDDYYAIIGHLGLSAQLRPAEPLLIRLGLGFGAADFYRKKNGLEQVVGQAGGWYALAVGYEIFLGCPGESGGFSLTPIAGFEVGPGDPTTSLTGWIGLELSYWTGLPGNQLDLPMERAYQ